MSTQTVYVHIGQPKTGTSAIQTFLKANRDLLAQQGYVYPRKSHLLSWIWSDVSGQEAASRDAWNCIQKELRASNKDFILSNEAISDAVLVNPKCVPELKAMLAPAAVKIVYYLRRQDLHFESLYRQWVRAEPVTTPFGPEAIVEMISAGYYDYAAQVRALEAGFGRENVILRVYDRNNFSGGFLANDFCHAVGLDWQVGFTVPPKTENPSVDARLTDILLAANATMPSLDGELREFKELIQYVGAATLEGTETKYFTGAERVAFMERLHEGNRWVARRYFGREELFDLSNLHTLGEPKRLSAEDRHRLFFNLNAAWLQGLGATPFPLYMELKGRHLDLKISAATGRKRMLLSLARPLLRVLIFGCGLSSRTDRKSLNKTILRCIGKDIKLGRLNRNDHPLP